MYFTGFLHVFSNLQIFENSNFLDFPGFLVSENVDFLGGILKKSKVLSLRGGPTKFGFFENIEK